MRLSNHCVHSCCATWTDVLTHLLENTARLWPAKMAQEVQREDLILLVPAFVLSQLQAGFEIGFLIYIPFIVIDLIVSTCCWHWACKWSRQ